MAQARAIGERMRATMERLRAGLPPGDRAPARLSRLLGVDRSICYRVFGGTGKESGEEIVLGLPGVAGSRQLVAAFGRHGAAKSHVAGAMAAIGAYAELVAESGGSQAGLIRALRRACDVVEAREDPGETARAKLSDATAEAMGVRCDAQVMTYLLTRGSGDSWIGRVAQAYLGVRGRAGHFPIATMVEAPARGSGPWTLDNDAAEGRTPGALLSQFSSDPFPPVTSERRGDRLVQVIDTATRRGLRALRGIDVVLGNRFLVQPVTRESPVHRVSLVPRIPTGRGVVDVVIDRSLGDVTAEPRGMYFVSHMGVVIESPESRWFDRGPGAPSVRKIGPADAEPWVWGAHARVLEYLAGEAEIDLTETVRYRMEMRWPMVGWQLLTDFRFTV